jgi:hypothetical protein
MSSALAACPGSTAQGGHPPGGRNHAAAVATQEPYSTAQIVQVTKHAGIFG